jgi:teichuronic acid biosynthesis glycosyltransferase TuaC
LNARVRLLGARPQTELARLYQAADFSFLCSNNEGLANAMVEALACGAPVVTTPVQGARETICAAAAGRIVVEPTADALAAAAREVLAANYAPTAVRTSAERFSWNRNTRDLLAHLSAIADRR